MTLLNVNELQWSCSLAVWQMLILEKVSEEQEFREKDRLKLENQQKEARGATGMIIVLVLMRC